MSEFTPCASPACSSCQEVRRLRQQLAADTSMAPSPAKCEIGHGEWLRYCSGCGYDFCPQCEAHSNWECGAAVVTPYAISALRRMLTEPREGDPA